MDCKDIVLLLPELSSGMLEGKDKENVMQHLETCGKCQEEFSKIEGFLGHIPVKSEEELAPPEGYFPDVWQNLYSRIQEEGLNKKENGIKGILKYISFLFKRRTYQTVTGSLVVLLCVTMYFSMQSDRHNPSKSLLSEFLRGAGLNEALSEIPLDIDNGKKQFSNVLSFGIGSTEKPIQQWGELLSSEKRQNFYESLTDYLADAVIKLERNEYND
ncbi:MAG: zf-HC2 domain-containing protein [bacterium]|nr:zf-HC2 domain-containing protein [bacterium]